MQAKLGKEEASLKIASGKLSHRPDPDRGEGKRVEQGVPRTAAKGRKWNSHTPRLQDEDEIAEVEKRTEELEDIGSFMESGADNECTNALAKLEPHLTCHKHGMRSRQETFLQFTRIRNNIFAHWVRQSLGAKRCGRRPKVGKYKDAIREDTAKVFAKSSARYGVLEKIVVDQSENGEGPDEHANVLATATKLDVAYNEIAEWYS